VIAGNVHEACGLVNCTYRQLDYWCRLGLIGELQYGRGSGSRRSFNDADLEVLYAVAGVYHLNGREELAARVRDAVRVRRVSPDHDEFIVITDGQQVHRVGALSDEFSWTTARVIRLRPFVPADVAPRPDLVTSSSW
jgi:hypothetical protein